jgi:hypothetical protein
MTNKCTITGHSCYVFPTRRWISIIPGSIIATGTVTLALAGMNNG